MTFSQTAPNEGPKALRFPSQVPEPGSSHNSFFISFIFSLHYDYDVKKVEDFTKKLSSKPPNQ